MIGILTTLAVLGLAVFVHELGHFLMMRRNGIQVDEFSIGFGPKVFSWVGRNGTTYNLRALPLGGFVQPRQNGPTSMAEAKPWVKFKVAIAGSVMNALFCHGGFDHYDSRSSFVSTITPPVDCLVARITPSSCDGLRIFFWINGRHSSIFFLPSSDQIFGANGWHGRTNRNSSNG